MLKVTAIVKIQLRADQINLPKWFYSFSEKEFQKSSPSNLEMGFSKNINGKKMFWDKVGVAGHLLINQYTEDAAEVNFLKMTSLNSKLFLFHLIPIVIKVTYELSIKPVDQESAELVCISIGEYPEWLEIISKLTLAKIFLQKHQDEETEYFAGDILKKFG